MTNSFLRAGLGLALLPTLALAQPTITSLSPAPNATAASGSSPVQVTFSQPLTAASAAALKVHSAQRGGLRTRPATPAVVSGNTLSYTPPAGQPFVPGETMTVSVTRAAASTGGPLARPRVAQFRVATSPASPGAFAGGTDPATGNRPTTPVLADVDGDGDLDLLTCNVDSRSVSIRLNGGDASGSNTGVFSNGSEVYLNNTPRNLAVGDLDNDGDLDLVVTESLLNGTVTIRLNGGDTTGSNTGVFSNGPTLAVGLSAGALALGDVDGDGDLDLVYTDGPCTNCLGTAVAVLNGRDNSGQNVGVFALTAATAVRVGNTPNHIALGDVDGDGDLDLLTANYGISTGTTVSVRLNGGDASGSNTGTFSNGTDPTVGSRPSMVALGDVDGDGDLDLLTSNAGDNTVSVRLNGGDASGSGTGIFSAGSTVAVGTDPRGVVLGDVDGDGDLDFVTANSAGRVDVRLNGGATGLNTGLFAGTASVAVGANPAAPTLGDVDGDGDLDLVTANYNLAGTASVRLNGGVAVAPVITAIVPASGPVGTTVTLTGVRLSTATGLTLNGVAVPLANITANTATSLTFTVPASGTTGPVVVTNAGGSSAAGGPVFTVTPSLSNLVVSAGALTPTFAGGTTAYTLTVPGSVATTTVTPTNAQVPGGVITVNGAAVASGASSLTLPLATGSNTLTIVVDAPGGGGSTTYTVTIVRAACVATATARNLSLTLGADGTATLTPAQVDNGSNSTCGTPTLSLSRSTFDCADVGAPVPVTLTVTDGYGGTATATATVTVLSPPAATLTTLSPATAAVGSTVTATGTNLAGATSLVVNGVTTPLTARTATGFSFVVPAGASPSGTVQLALPCGQTVSLPFNLLPTATAAGAAAQLLTLYPNPAHGSLTVQRPAAGVASGALLNSLGQAVRTLTLPTAETTVDLRGLAAGVYTLRLVLDGQPVARRVVVE